MDRSPHKISLEHTFLFHDASNKFGKKKNWKLLSVILHLSAVVEHIVDKYWDIHKTQLLEYDIPYLGFCWHAIWSWHIHGHMASHLAQPPKSKFDMFHIWNCALWTSPIFLLNPTSTSKVQFEETCWWVWFQMCGSPFNSHGVYISNLSRNIVAGLVAMSSTT